MLCDYFLGLETFPRRRRDAHDRQEVKDTYQTQETETRHKPLTKAIETITFVVKSKYYPAELPTSHVGSSKDAAFLRCHPQKVDFL